MNTSISYYTKGALIGWLLDARIRHATDGRKSLGRSDARRRMRSSPGERGYTPDQFKTTAEEVAGVPLRDFFARSAESTEELDYSEALDWFGLRFKGPAGGDSAKKAFIGVETRVDNGRLVIRSVPRETPAYESGLSAEDEILGIGDFRVRPDQLAARLENYKPGDKVSILVSRREQLLRFEVTLGARTAEVATGSAARRDGRAKGAPRGLAENQPLPLGTIAKGVGSGCELACLSRRKIFVGIRKKLVKDDSLMP